jgi:hypothetical protein
VSDGMSWTIRRMPAEARAAAIRCAEARHLTVGEWVAMAIERQASAEGQAPPEGGLELRSGACVRLIGGGPVMVLTGPERLFAIGQAPGRWEAVWFHKGNLASACFWPQTLELAAGA